MELLHKKSGSTASLKEFRRKVKMIVESDVLPDYRLRYQPEADQVLFTPRTRKGSLKASVHHPPHRSIEHLTSVHQTPIIGLSDTKVSVHQTPMLRSIRHRGPKFGWYLLGFPDYSHPITRARDLNNLSNVLTPNPSPE